MVFSYVPAPIGYQAHREKELTIMGNGMIAAHELYVYPYPLKTLSASMLDPDRDYAEYTPWEQKKAGEYLYLHPFWYVYDDQGKLCLVGKTNVKTNKNDKIDVDLDEMRLELEMLLHMPIAQRLTLIGAIMNSMMILTVNPEEPAHMFHSGSHVVVASWLYKVDKKGVLQSVGKCQSSYRGAKIDECLLMMGVQSGCDVNIAPDHEWKNLTSIEEEPMIRRPAKKEDLIHSLIDGFKDQIDKQEKLPKIGDEITATTTDGYKVVAYCIPGDENAPVHPEYGKASFAMAIRIYNPDGTVLTEDAK